MINQMQTDDMELKKLVYLYLINYAKVRRCVRNLGWMGAAAGCGCGRDSVG